VERHLAEGQRVSLGAAFVTQHTHRQAHTLAVIERRPAPQIGQRERRDAVSAELGAKYRVQIRVLRDAHQLAVAIRPASRREVEADEPDLAEHRLLRPRDCRRQRDRGEHRAGPGDAPTFLKRRHDSSC
jgi:hypothetical protein